MAEETLEQANQRKFSKMFDILSVFEDLVYKGVMRALNWEVKDNAGQMKSVFDLVRDGGGAVRIAPWYGHDGKRPPVGKRRTTTLIDDVGWEDTRNNGLSRQILTLQKTVESLALSTGAVIDLDAIAKAVNDEEDRRNAERLAVSVTDPEAAKEASA